MPTSKLILGFVGELSSGKGTACQYLAKKYDAPSYRFSTILRDILNRLYLDITRDHLQRLSTALRGEFGQDVLAKVIAQDVKNDPHSIITVDGIRRLSDITYLKDVAGFHLVYLTADQNIRYQRIIARGENSDDKNKTFEQFQADEQAEAELQITSTGATAEYTVTNNGTFEELYEQLEKLTR